MNTGKQFGLLLASHLFLFFAIGESNTFLSSLGIHLSLDLLLLVFPGLFLPVYPGLITVLVLGLLAGTATPIATALHLIGYLILWVLLVWSRTRVRTHDKWHLGFTAILLQLLWMLALTLLLARPFPGLNIHGKLLIDAFCSSLALLFMVPAWCSLQKYLLLATGWNLDASSLRS